jgi:hypothetical protein
MPKTLLSQVNVLRNAQQVSRRKLGNEEAQIRSTLSQKPQKNGARRSQPHA